MKRVWDIPWGKKFLTEALLPDWEIIPRSWTEEWIFRFPVEVEVAKKKYPNMLDVLTYEFKKQVHWIYEWEVVIDRIRKQNWQANDKMFVYDKNTGANFSMDIQDVFNIITWVAQWRVWVKKEWDKYIISSKFIMRWHFLSPYSEENQIEQEVKWADTLSAKDVVPSLSKVYITKKWEKYIYLWKGYVKSHWKREYKTWDRKIEITSCSEQYNGHIYIRVIENWYGKYEILEWLKTKKTNFILTEDFDLSMVKDYFKNWPWFHRYYEYTEKFSTYDLPEVKLTWVFAEQNITNQTNKWEYD